jgi:pimeloyl-ACP methyl ester carboxylesterase
MSTLALLLGLMLVAGLSRSAGGQPPLPKSFSLEVPMQTLGGLVLWADELVYYDWRIQRNTLTGHCRLLDGDNRRHTWGSFQLCLARLEEIKRERNLPPMKGKVVLILHGLGDVRLSAEGLARYLHDEGGYLAFAIGYPSLFDDIAHHAQSLASVIEHLEGAEEINLVGHSMGNLVIRYYLGEQTDAAKGRKPDPRIRRIVMIGPPNNGAKLAEEWGDNPAFIVLFGPAGQQLGKRWPQIAPKLAVPSCEFAIIAGGRGDSRGMGPLVEGDNDGLITVESTRLPGARDFLIVPEVHFFMLHSRTVMECTLRFLKHGWFVEPKKPAEP